MPSAFVAAARDAARGSAPGTAPRVPAEPGPGAGAAPGARCRPLLIPTPQRRRSSTAHHLPPGDDVHVQLHRRSPDLPGAPPSDRFGAFGGRYVPETLIAALDELEAAYAEAMADPAFRAGVRPPPPGLRGAPLSPLPGPAPGGGGGGGPIYLKREDLNHTGAHKINNTIGQALLARRMGKKRIIAETGAGQHGVATATACALFDLECVVYMGAEDVERQALNVFRMELLGAEIRPVPPGPDAQGRHQRGHPGLGHERGGHPLHHRIGGGARALPPHGPGLPVRHRDGDPGADPRAGGAAPRRVVACVGAAPTPWGSSTPSWGRGRPPGGRGGRRGGAGDGAALRLPHGREPGVLHGALSYLLQDDDGQVAPAHSVSAGLDYPGVGPEHSFLKDSGRATYVAVGDDEALAPSTACRSWRGSSPLWRRRTPWRTFSGKGAEVEDGPVLLCLSGRGDKDVAHVARVEGRGSIL
jgi:tryptophan synthase beta chain